MKNCRVWWPGHHHLLGLNFWASVLFNGHTKLKRERKGQRKKSGQREEREPFLQGEVLTEKKQDYWTDKQTLNDF